ncbi:MAG: glycosyltransferase [Rhabdochlamydiaceae bacterium]|nr:glycosyltransferase [Candidatus Amphrikana amoebophyrae]
MLKRVILILLVSISCYGKGPTICLNMIVKNEADVIARCLETVKPYIDHWVIVDTGSTDGTQDIILKTMKGIKGELYQSEWKNFGYNRNESLHYAKGKCEYILFIDADEQLLVQGEDPFGSIDKDYYFGHVLQRNTASRRILLVKDACDWYWKGIIHESLDCQNAFTNELLTTAQISAETKDGCRSKDPNKALKDAAVLEQGVIDEPNNARYRFFLGQCYQNASEFQKALENYAIRAKMGGWEQEQFYATYQVGRMQQKLDYPIEEVIKTYNLAVQLRPSRLEPIFELARIHLMRGEVGEAYILSKHGLSMPFSDDIIHVDGAIYKWGMKVIAAECALKVGAIEEAMNLSDEILSLEELPEDLAKAMPEFKQKCEEALAQRILEELSGKRS